MNVGTGGNVIFAGCLLLVSATKVANENGRRGAGDGGEIGGDAFRKYAIMFGS